MRKTCLIVLLILFCTGCSLRPSGREEGITLEVAIFEGGYGIAWHKSIARKYEALHPGIKINLWGDPRVDEKLRPRILRRNPPDLASCSLPAWKLIVSGKLLPLDSALDSPAFGQNISWRSSLTKGILADFQYQGHAYSIPSNLNAWVCWYDKRLFRKHGWNTPKTWSDFTRLCEQIKSMGVAPIAFQGKYPTYAWSILLSLYQRLVPFEKWYAAQDLTPGAFLDPEFIHAARLMQEMATKYYQAGAMAMTHTESQLEWVNGRAALVFCGLWLKNEMKNAIPNGFEMACFPVPMVEGGKGDPNAIYGGGGENYFVFKDAQHPREAMDFLKYLLSVESAQSYIQKLDTLSTVQNAVQGIRISPELQSAVDVIQKSSRIYSDRLSGLYLEFGKTGMPDALAELLTNKTTPEEFARRLEAACEKVRRNPEVYKPPPMGVPE